MRVLDVMIKDLKIILSDKKALAVMILMPIILTTILGLALKGSFTEGTDIKSINIAIVKSYDKEGDIERFKEVAKNALNENVSNIDLSQIDLEKIFFSEFLGNEELRFIEYKVTKEHEAMEMLKNKLVSAVIILPENFIYDMYINFLTPFRNKVDIQVIGHPDYSLSSRIIQEIMKGFSDVISSMIITKNVFIETSMESNIGNRVYEDVEKVLEQIMDNWQSSGINIEYKSINGKKPITSFAYYSVAMVTMFILFAAGTGSRTLLEEKDNLTYQRMKIAGVSKWKILSGKFFTIFMISLIQVSVMILYSKLALKVDWGNMISIFIISCVVSFAIAGLGIVIAVITYMAGNYKAANIFENAVIQAMALFGGSFIPIDVMPKFMQKISNFTLNGLALKSYLKIMQEAGVGEILIPLVSLFGMGIVFVAIAVYILGKEGGTNVKYNNVKISETA